MKILLIFTFNRSLTIWDKAGIISRESALYKKLLEKKIDISFLTFGDNEDFNYSRLLNGIKIIPALNFIKSKNRKISILKSIFLPLKLKNVFKNIDIIKTNQLEGSWIGWLAKILYRKKFIVRGGFEWLKFYILENESKNRKKNLRYWLKYLWIYLIEFISYKLADKIILTNLNGIEFIINKFKLKKKKIRHFYNYIDSELFKPINLEKKDKHVLFIGRLNHQKNFLNLLNAFIDLEGFTLDIIGDDGPYKKVLKQKAFKFDIKINFLGIIPNNQLPDIINQYHLFILPSFYEGNPKVLLEAMSCGLACIGTNVYGINNIVIHKENGFLCETNSDSIRNAIITLYNDRELRQKIGTKAREFILNNCSFSSNVNKEYLFYKKLLF